MNIQRPPRENLWLVALVSLVSIAVLIDTRTLSPARYDPLGAAGVPVGIAAGLLALCALMLVRDLLVPATARAANGDYRRRHGLALAVMLETVAYVAVLDLALLGFLEATMAFLIVAIVTMAGYDRRTLVGAVALSVTLSMSVTWLFTRVLFIDLP